METRIPFFDTHKHFKELIKTGLTEAQAEAIVNLIFEVRNYDFSKLTTRESDASTKREIRSVE